MTERELEQMAKDIAEINEYVKYIYEKVFEKELKKAKREIRKSEKKRK